MKGGPIGGQMKQEPSMHSLQHQISLDFMNQINHEGQFKKGSQELKPFSPMQQRRMIEENSVGFNEPSIQKMMN
jgi:hypothetical protein